jgi:hypothetical protein
LARGIVQHYLGVVGSLPPLAVLDDLVEHWRLRPGGDRIDVNDLVNAVGISFGQHLANRLHLDWVIATDESGTDLALHGEPGHLVIFPANAVAKRVVAGEARFVEPLYTAIVTDIEQVRGG